MVQLADSYDPSIYSRYAFAGGGARAYRDHLRNVSDQICSNFSKDSSILEVGAGDGSLVSMLIEKGYAGTFGIDPSRAAKDSTSQNVVHGFFPDDLPNQNQEFDLIICRHVLEHIEEPRAFLAAMRKHLSPQGQLLIEVPDLDSTVDGKLWSNFYQLHCNYFNSATLCRMVAEQGLMSVHREVVEIFGGSILHRFAIGHPNKSEQPISLDGIAAEVACYRDQLSDLASRIPTDSVGYGAAERTAAMLGFSPKLCESISGLYDGNPLLSDRYLGGTKLPIKHKETLFKNPPPAIVLFALSNTKEILEEWKTILPPSTLVAIPNKDFPLAPLSDY